MLDLQSHNPPPLGSLLGDVAPNWKFKKVLKTSSVYHVRHFLAPTNFMKNELINLFEVVGNYSTSKAGRTFEMKHK